MRTLRTPDERFVGLAGFDFPPHYAEIPDGDGGSLRVHFVDEGTRDGPTVLLLHGEPSWSYLYRTMIGPLVAAGFRVVAPDQVGFGRSDKPAAIADYSYARHVEWMSALVFRVLDLRDVTFFGQDWGGLIGLRLVAAEPDRFSRVAIANTGLPDGSRSPSEAFLQWQEFARTAPTLPIGSLVDLGSASQLPPEVVAAYDAPFPSDEFMAGARAWPLLVPTSPDDPAAAPNRDAWEVLERFDRPFVCWFSDADPITSGGEHAFIGRVAGAAGRRHEPIRGAGHFLQEDAGPELARRLVDFVRSGE